MVKNDPVLTVADIRFSKLTQLLGRFGLSLQLLNDGAAIRVNRRAARTLPAQCSKTTPLADIVGIIGTSGHPMREES